MAWPVLILSSFLEAIWATALGASEGFSRPGPTVVFVIAVIASTIGLGYAMKSIPTGTAYAVWTGIGAALTVTWALITGTETFGVLKVVFLIGIIVCVVGLQVLDRRESRRTAAERVSDVVAE